MLTMKVLEDAAAVKEYAARDAIPYEDGLCIYLAENRGEELGICYYIRRDYGMEILHADAGDDLFLLDGVVRSAMSKLFDMEKDMVSFDNCKNLDQLRSLDVLDADKTVIESANTFFETHKNCKK